MCGFSGVIFGNTTLLEAYKPGLNGFRTAARRVAHRGDTDQQEQLFSTLWLNHYRLAFQDVHSGAQPMVSADGKHVIVFNGEVYNHLKIRDAVGKTHNVNFKTRSDTETILEIWKCIGDELFDLLEGEYAFVICDLEGENLVAHRDRSGVKPLYFYLENIDSREFANYRRSYSFSSPRLEFSSEIKGIIAGKSWNRDGLLRQYVGLFEPICTPFEHIINIPAGGKLTAKNRNGQFRCILETSQRPVRQAVRGCDVVSNEQLREAFGQSVEARLLSDVELGVYLSGGIDSKAVAYELAKLKPDAKIKSFTIGFTQEGYDETEEALNFSNYLGLKNYVVRIDDEALSYSYPLAVQTSELVQPFTNGAAKWWLSLFTRQYVQGVLTGDGADEIFCGYPSYRYANWWKAVMRSRGKMSSASDVLESLKKAPLGTYKRDGLYKAKFSSHAKNPWLSGSSAEGDGQDFVDSIEVLGIPHPLFGQIRAIAETLLGDDADSWLRSQAESMRSWFAAGFSIDENELCNPENALLLWQNYFYKAHLPTLILNWVGDRMEMANTLEGRTPFLSKHMVDLIFAQPDRALVHGLRDKVSLRRAYADMFPQRFAHTPKKQFNAPFIGSEELQAKFGTEAVFEEAGLANNDALQTLKRKIDSETDAYKATHFRASYQTAISLSIVNTCIVKGVDIEHDRRFEGRYLSASE